MAKLGVRLGVGVALAGVMASAALAADALHLVVRPQASVGAGSIVLADVVEGDGLPQALAKVPLAAAPLAGHVVRLDRRQLRQALAGRWPGSVQWDGAALVEVRRASQELVADHLCAAALELLRERARTLPTGVSFEAQCSAPAEPVLVGAGALQLQVDAGALRLVDGPATLPVLVRVDGVPERTVKLHVRLDVEADRWCAREAVPAGAEVSEARFAACRLPARSVDVLEASGRPLPAGRLQHALHAGEPLAARDVADAATQLRGDAVVVVYQAGAVALESRGELGQDARIGDAVRVRIQSSGQTVIGRLAAAGRVEIGDR